jgi:A/G-specific adenine glycosylase
MLQQTQVVTVLPYYLRWMERFPTVEALARANEQDVLSLWQGLGYYRRCRMLLAGARWVVLNGLPGSAADWRLVPGVGRYTAAAISSMSTGEPVAVVDGNVERVFARYAECSLTAGLLTKAAWEWASDQLAGDRPGDWNQAMMELGATICRPRDPLCSSCPISHGCIARERGRQGELPVPAKQAATVTLQREAWVHVWNGQFGLEQVPEGEWWRGMWRFPTSSFEGIESGDALIGIVKHAVTNHRITMKVHLADLRSPISHLRWFTLEELKHLPMPAPQRRALRIALASMGDLDSATPPGSNARATRSQAI